MWVCLSNHLLTEVDSALDQVVLIVARITIALHHVVTPVLEELAIIAGRPESSTRGRLEGAVMIGVAPEMGIFPISKKTNRERGFRRCTHRFRSK